MKRKEVYVLTLNDWCKEGKCMRVYDTFDEARKVMKREVKSYLKKNPDWEVDYQTEDRARVHLITTFFDKNTKWEINRATMETMKGDNKL